MLDRFMRRRDLRQRQDGRFVGRRSRQGCERPPYAGVIAQPAVDKLLERLRAVGANFDQETPLTDHPMYLLDARKLGHELAHIIQIAASRRLDEDKRCDLQPDHQRIYERGVTLDVASLLQKLDPPQ